MPVSFTFDDIVLALAREAFSEYDIVDLTTDSAGAADGTTVIFGDLAHGSSGITDTAFHDVYMYLRRFTGLATAGGASTITLRTSMGTLAADVLKNFTIKITAGTSSGDERTISANSNASPSVVTVSSAFTSTPDTTSYYEIYPSGSAASSQIIRTAKALTTSPFAVATGAITVAPGFNGDAGANMLMGIGAEMLFYRERPNLHINSINRLLRGLAPPTFFPLSLHIVANDANDMVPSTIATDYNSTGATLATESTIVRNGVQSLKSTATVAGGFANLDAVIGVQEGQSLYAAVDCYVTSGDDAQFAILNKFNAQLIDTATSDEPSWMELVIQFTIPPSCEQIDLIMSGDASGDVTYWANPQVWGGTRVYPVPSWIQRESQVIDVREFPLGETGPGTNDYLTNTRLSRPLEWWFEREDTTATEKVHIGVKAGSGRPYIVASRPLGELTTDTAVTRVSQDLVVQGAMYYISKARAAKLMFSNPSLAGFHNSRAREYGRAYSRMLKDLGIPEVRLRDESTDRQSVRFR